MNDGPSCNKKLNRRQKKIMSILTKMADDVMPIKSSKHAAAIVLGNEIISFGINSKKSDPFAAKYGRNEHCIFLHAEVDAIKKAINRIGTEKLQWATLLVIRRKQDIETGEYIYGNSKPCDGCTIAINEYGIREVIYT